MISTLLLVVVLAQTCEHPVYLKNGPVQCSEIVPSTAFGKVVYRTDGRMRTLSAARVDLTRTMQAAKGKPRVGSLSLASTGGTGTPFVYRAIPIPERAARPKSAQAGSTQTTYSRRMYSQPTYQKPLMKRSDRRNLKMARAQAERQLKTQRLNNAMATSELHNRVTLKNYIQAKYERDRLRDLEQRTKLINEVLDSTR